MKTLILALAILTLNVGCKSFSHDSYVASGVTHITARTALKAWNEYLAKEYAKADTKRTSELMAQERQVKLAYEKYVDSQMLVLVVSQEYGRLQPNDPNTPVVNDRLTVAINSATVTLESLMTLLEKFGIKLN